MEAITYTALGIAIFAATIAVITLVRTQKLEELVRKHRTETLDLIQTQCAINQKQQDIDEITCRRLDQTEEMAITAMKEIEKLKRKDK